MPPKKVKRADNRYQTTLTIGRTPEGKPIKKYFYGDTQKEAQAKKKEYLESVSDGVKPNKDMLKDWIEVWIASSSSKKEIRDSNQLYADKLLDYLGDMPIADIRLIDIKGFAQFMSKYSFSAVKKTKSVVNRLFADAVRNRMIRFNPCDGIVWEYASRGSHRALENWEKELIVSNHKVHRTGLWAVLMLFAGLRRGEALALDWEDIDFKEGVVHVSKAYRFEGNAAVLSTTKTEAGVRDVPLLPQLRSVLEEYDSREGRVCKTANNSKMTQSAFKRGWESWLNAMENILNDEAPENQGRRTDIEKKKAKKEKAPKVRKKFSVRTHDLRHTFCTMLYKAGIGLKDAQYIMGHADSKMTLEVYTHLDREQQLSAAAILKKYNDVFKDEKQQDVSQDVKNP